MRSINRLIGLVIFLSAIQFTCIVALAIRTFVPPVPEVQPKPDPALICEHYRMIGKPCPMKETA